MQSEESTILKIDPEHEKSTAKEERKRINAHKVAYKRNNKFLSDKNGPRAYKK